MKELIEVKISIADFLKTVEIAFDRTKIGDQIGFVATCVGKTDYDSDVLNAVAETYATLPLYLYLQIGDKYYAVPFEYGSYGFERDTTEAPFEVKRVPNPDPYIYVPITNY